MKTNRFLALFALVFIFASCGGKKPTISDKLPWSERMALSEMVRNPSPTTLDFQTKKRWTYTNAQVCEAILKLYRSTDKEEYLTYSRRYADSLITESGEILTYKLSNYNLDLVNPGKYTLMLYDLTGEPWLKTAADTLWSQLQTQPRTTRRVLA